MKEGYVKIYRTSMNDPLYMKEAFTKWQAWCDLILMAYHSPSDFFVRDIKVKAKRGCVYLSVNELQKRWRWSKGKVERFLKYLKEDGRIKVEATKVVSCIIIRNYAKYQSESKENDNISKSLASGSLHQQIVNQIQAINDRLDAQELQAENKPRRKKESNPLITKGREVFEKKFSDLFGDSYYWQAKDAVAMGSLTNKIIFSRQQKGMSIDTDDVIKALEEFLCCVSDEWLLNNFSVTNINSKYNEIVARARAELSNGKTNRQKVGNKRRSSEVTASKPEDYEGAF